MLVRTHTQYDCNYFQFICAYFMASKWSFLVHSLCDAENNVPPAVGRNALCTSTGSSWLLALLSSFVPLPFTIFFSIIEEVLIFKLYLMDSKLICLSSSLCKCQPCTWFKLKPGAEKPVQDSQVGVRGTSTWTISCCLSGVCICRKLQNNWDLNQSLQYGM